MPDFTTANVLSELRNQLQDTGTTKRYSDADLYGRLSLAQRRILEGHPEATCTESAISTSIPDDVDGSTNPALDDSYFMAMVHYAAHLVFLEDAEDLGNRTKAEKHYELYLLEVL